MSTININNNNYSVHDRQTYTVLKPVAYIKK